MSSFVIDKRSYVRVGAIVAGIAKATRGTNRELWLYDNVLGRNLKGTDFVDKFVECYKLNVDSVCKQYAHCHDEYCDPKTYEDNNDYDDDYIRYFKFGEGIADSTLDLMDVVWNLIYFSRSVNYQIEDPIDNQIVMEWFNLVIAKLTQIADLKDDRDMWGEFDLNLDKYRCLD